MTYNSYFVDQFVSQIHTSKSGSALYFSTEGFLSLHVHTIYITIFISKNISLINIMNVHTIFTLFQNNFFWKSTS
jgi:hypothetical protein